jgi:hypothetical protein
MSDGNKANVAERCRYSGYDVNELPEPIGEAVREMIAQLPVSASVMVQRHTDEDGFLKLPDGRMINPDDFRAFFASDSSGLDQVCFNEGNDYYRVRIWGVPQDEKERIMGYDKSKLETLSDPGKPTVWNWLIEGEPKK